MLKQTNMNNPQTLEQLRKLRLNGMANRYEALLKQPTGEEPGAHELIASLAEAEQIHRGHKRTELYLRTSKLRYNATLEQIHHSSTRGITKDHIFKLSDGGFIERGENVLITGATGTGKSFIGCALGRQACLLGYRVLYFSMNRFIEELASVRLKGIYLKWLNKIAKTPLLIIDDFGLARWNTDTKLTFLQILEDRFAKASTIITAQMPVNKWYEYISEPTIADATLDRLTANAHKLELKGDSLRNKNCS